ncbi:hypothetical protein DL98DRAFT_627798 [Cadophora sp. DSE1049]|nr:hypothetical protein DL98DRAFT_627798 [Cadophora sp. DSE1049]
MFNMLLTGRISLITGASRGIGAAITQRFAKEGARCILVGRNERLLENVRAGLENAEPARQGVHRFVIGDVGDGSFWENMHEKNIDISCECRGRHSFFASFYYEHESYGRSHTNQSDGYDIGFQDIEKNTCMIFRRPGQWSWALAPWSWELEPQATWRNCCSEVQFRLQFVWQKQQPYVKSGGFSSGL